MQIATSSGGIASHKLTLQRADVVSKVLLAWLKQAAESQHLQWVAASIEGEDQPADLASKLWLREDIVPYVLPGPAGTEQRTLQERVQELASSFDENNNARTQFLANHEVQVSALVTLADYQQRLSAV